MMVCSRGRRALAVASVALGLTLAPHYAGAQVLYGFTNFPHELSEQATAQVHARTVPNSNLYAQHMDQCIPWHEVIDDDSFPAWLQADIEEIRAYREPHQVMYVAVTPTQNDRRSLSEACGDSDDETRSVPRSIRGEPLNDEGVKEAYVEYVRRIVDALDPTYINIGIEISELALRHPDEWDEFDELFRHTVDALKVSHPDVQVGLELVLQSIMEPNVGRMVKPTAEHGDYIGISFYPYGSEFGEIFGAPALPPPPAQWRVPFDFLRDWTNKPVAIAETGYASETVVVEEGPGITFPGSRALQQQFLEDLIRVAVRDDYLFVVWFVPVDYSRLLSSLAAYGGVPEWMKIWVTAGLFEPDLSPKPAFALWDRWQNQQAVQRQGAWSAATPAAQPARATAAGQQAAAPVLDCSSSASRVAAVSDTPPGLGAVEWRIEFGDDWELCTVDVDGFGGAQWSKRSLAWDAFAEAPYSEGNGRLEPSKIVSVTFGEGSGADGKSGSRRIYLTKPMPAR